MTKIYRSRLLSSVHETAEGLNQGGDFEQSKHADVWRTLLTAGRKHTNPKSGS